MDDDTAATTWLQVVLGSTVGKGKIVPRRPHPWTQKGPKPPKYSYMGRVGTFRGLHCKK